VILADRDLNMDTNNCSDGENNIGENVSVFST